MTAGKPTPLTKDTLQNSDKYWDVPKAVAEFGKGVYTDFEGFAGGRLEEAMEDIDIVAAVFLNDEDPRTWPKYRFIRDCLVHWVFASLDQGDHRPSQAEMIDQAGFLEMIISTRWLMKHTAEEAL